MTEYDFEILRTYLSDSFENKNESISYFDDLEDYFSLDCGACGLFLVFQHTYNHKGMLVRITVTSRKKIDE